MMMWFCSPVLASGTAVAAGEEGGVGATADGSGQTPVAFEPEVRGSDVAVFVAGVIPFAWATGSFWTRVLKGEVFGTGRDRVVFDQPFSDNGAKPGARKLTSAALNVSYALFIIAGGSLALALVAFLQAK